MKPVNDKSLSRSSYLVNQESTYYPPIVALLNGRYGTYAKMNGCNYSLKEMASHGYAEKQLSSDELTAIANKNKELRRLRAIDQHNKFMATLTEITLTFQNGKEVESVGNFKNNAENTGMKTQGSDAHEAILFMSGEKVMARKHWSNDGIGLWIGSSLESPFGDFIGDVHFIDGKTFVRKY